MTDAQPFAPQLSVAIPTHNNLAVLRRCIHSWRTHAGAQPVELLIIEDGCSDGTAEYLEELCQTAWGSRTLRVLHEEDAHELRCTNRGLTDARAPLVLAWQDDMYLETGWLVPELIRTFEAYPELGMLSLSRGLLFVPSTAPIHAWDDLYDWTRLHSTIGPRILNWFRLQEVDGVIRPWVVRASCVQRTGLLDEAFVPTEWDESDLAYRIRAAGWMVATHGYERAGAYFHVGSTTISRTPPAPYRERVLQNALLFYSRWSSTIEQEHGRRRRSWWRLTPARGWMATLARASQSMLRIRRAGKNEHGS